MDPHYAIQCLRTIHETVSPIVIGLAQDRAISRADMHAIRRLPSVSAAMLEACELPAPEISTRRLVAPEGAATRALCHLLARTTEAITACASQPTPLAHIAMRAVTLTAIHALTWELVFALNLQGT